MKNLFSIFSRKSNEPVSEPVAPVASVSSDISQQQQPSQSQPQIQTQPEPYVAPVESVSSPTVSMSGDITPPPSSQQPTSVFGGLADISAVESGASPTPVPIPVPPSYQQPSTVYSGPTETPSQPDAISGYTPSNTAEPVADSYQSTPVADSNQPAISVPSSDVIADILSQPVPTPENNSPSQPTPPTVPPTNQF